MGEDEVGLCADYVVGFSTFEGGVVFAVGEIEGRVALETAVCAEDLVVCVGERGVVFARNPVGDVEEAVDLVLVEDIVGVAAVEDVVEAVEHRVEVRRLGVGTEGDGNYGQQGQE